MSGFLEMKNAGCCPLSSVPHLEAGDFSSAVAKRVKEGLRISALLGTPDGDDILLLAVLADDRGGTLELCRSRARESFPSLAVEVPQAHWFEREIAEQWGLVPEGHPWLKPIRFHRSWRNGFDAWGRGGEEPVLPGVTDYFRVEGDEVHEVAVGPVHAGIIEPGHFRFQCHGERVFHLEIELGYQHRGIERSLVGGPDKRTLHFMETLAGDTTIGHALAYASIVEALSGTCPPEEARRVRAVALELERLANHTGDLGAMAGDIGYQPTASYCGRIRGDFLNATAMVCGNRFGRGLVCPGGVRKGLVPGILPGLERHLEAAFTDAEQAVSLLWKTPSVMGRFEETGRLSREEALALGLVGPAARACGIRRDIRSDFPNPGCLDLGIAPAMARNGDVDARARVRRQEIHSSFRGIMGALGQAGGGELKSVPASLGGGQVAVSLVEGWRGEICHVALTDAAGRFSRYKVVDPSFHNWAGLAMALRDQEISDFPLCNKSFNLSYCGHDL
jgi:Ni,Fe-hydrogenase III large subunit